MSLKNQTFDNWQAIVGIDAHNVNVQGFPMQFYDQRFSFILIATLNKDRGPRMNGAGEVRNIIITDAARGEWVAFLDDDDTVSPYYAEWLRDLVTREEKKHKRRVDLVLFRMRTNRPFHVRRNQTVLPPFSHGNRAHNSWVGISYAVRRDVFTSKRLAFVSSNAEDYNLLRDAYKSGLNVKISNCIAYFVKASPEISPASSCVLNNLTIA
jgi:hypothetical protein